MSLDDAIKAARQQAQMWDEVARQKREQEQRDRDEVVQLGKEGAARLAGFGNEMFVRVERAKWFQLVDTYRDPEGVRYTVASRQRCWVLAKMAGIRDRDRGGQFLDSPVLLLRDGTIGRFWPIPQQLRPSAPDEDDINEYVSTIDLDPIDDGSSPLFIGSGDRNYVNAVKRHIAQAVVAYERHAH